MKPMGFPRPRHQGPGLSLLISLLLILAGAIFILNKLNKLSLQIPYSDWITAIGCLIGGIYMLFKVVFARHRISMYV